MDVNRIAKGRSLKNYLFCKRVFSALMVKQPIKIAANLSEISHRTRKTAAKYVANFSYIAYISKSTLKTRAKNYLFIFKRHPKAGVSTLLQELKDKLNPKYQFSLRLT